MIATNPISSPSQHIVQTKNLRTENLRNHKWETSYKKATTTCHFILRQMRSHSLCFLRHECRFWVLWNWLPCFPCPRCIFIRRNFRAGNFNTNRSIITGDVKYGIKIPNMSCFLFIIFASGDSQGSVQGTCPTGFPPASLCAALYPSPLLRCHRDRAGGVLSVGRELV